MSLWKYLALAALVGLTVGPAAAAGDADRGEGIHAQRCEVCHGEEGDGAGAGAERLNPPPRDFTMAQYKIKTTGFEDILPDDDDLFRVIRDGMPGTSMPGWSDMLSDQDMWDLIAYLKVLGELEEEEPGVPVDFTTQIASSEDSIAKGKPLFEDRCVECHGNEGKGDAAKSLRDDDGERTWPRNLTKPWTFRASDDPKDIFARVSVGIAGTQMPPFADPKSKKKLTVEERWHVANYTASLGAAGEPVNPENTVVKAARIDGEVPRTPDDPSWRDSVPTTFYLVPQIIAEERHFTPSNDTITLRAVYNETDIAFLLQWDDRTKSIPGDSQAEKISGPGLAEDSVAVQLPVEIPEGMVKPYFVMGDTARPVNLWQWNSGTTDAPETVTLVNGRGIDNIEERDAAKAGVGANGSWRDGTWSVVMTRPLATAEPDADLQFVEGKFIPIAFAAWDGSNGETATKYTMTTWYWLLLAPEAGARPYVVALVVMLLVAAGLLWWARSAARRAGQAEG
ncbi:MAG: ethylbenzene dehydrogenase-related protein [Alphaproteobacteria bacterium]|nr:ethylbenzene dehydrogenase-related protein [Alphaproteobacteria bacterium]MDP6515384.1 ethylbenzene dehydrogenase-related protein [Alphaproteobacteria bacterium]